MWIANGWKEYEVIDTSCGEKLERWGKYLLVRPDPQVIWDTPKTEPGWRKMNAHYHRSSKGGGEWEFFDLPQQWDLRLQGSYIPSETIQLQAHRSFPGAGSKLGLVWRQDPQGWQTDQGSESVCLYRWCNSCGGSRRCIRYTRRCL